MPPALNDEQRVKFWRLFLLVGSMMLGLLTPSLIERFQAGTAEAIHYALLGGLVAVVGWSIWSIRRG
ncbi:MAG: hypothetical protein AAF799_32450 [Myxococcota bacterium]